MAQGRSPWPCMGDDSHGRSPMLTAHQLLLKFLLTIEISDTTPLSTPGPLTANGVAFLFYPPTRDTAEYDLRDMLLLFSSSPLKAHKCHDPAAQSMDSVFLQHASKFTQHDQQESCSLLDRVEEKQARDFCLLTAVSPRSSFLLH